MQLINHKIAVLGAGTSGLAAGRLASARGAQVTVYDSAAPEKLSAAAAKLDAAGLSYVFGDAALRKPQDGSIDEVVVSPGIDLASDIAQTFSTCGAPLIGEIELAWRCDPDTPVVAITGTNGKTTTTELVACLLNGAGIRSVAAGNYGRAYTDVVNSDESYDAITLELSSFQLETVDRFHPKVAVWMNFAPDHMDRYRTIEEYRQAKLRIFENLEAGDLAILNAAEIPQATIAARRVTFSAFDEDLDEAADWSLREGCICRSGESVLDFNATQLRGRHNAENLMAAMAAAAEMGAPLEGMAASVSDYVAPAHRCEFVGEVDGVSFINDSKATNLHALRSSLRGQEMPVVLIAGGKNKGLDYAELNDVVAKSVTHVIAIGEMADPIIAAWGGVLPCQRASSVAEAVTFAAQAAQPGQTVLFSPGTSSFDMFPGYEARGEAFRESVQQQKTTQP